MFVLLIACGGALTVDAGDADASGGYDGGPSLRYVYFFYDGASFCDTPGALRECHAETADDGGAARWRSIYADAGCVVDGDSYDCRAICDADGGHRPDCCDRFTPGGASEECKWSPP